MKHQTTVRRIAEQPATEQPATGNSDNDDAVREGEAEVKNEKRGEPILFAANGFRFQGVSYD